MADGGFCACGVYKLAPAALKPIRTLMVDQPDAFDAVLSALADATITLTDEATLAAMPRGFPTMPTIATPRLSKKTSLIVGERLPKAAWRSGGAVDRHARLARTAMPLRAVVRGEPVPV